MDMSSDFTFLNQRAKEFLDELSPKALPKNNAWRRLSDMGFEPDYQDSDAGEPPKGSE